MLKIARPPCTFQKVADSVRRNISKAEERKNASWINFFKRQGVGLLTGVALGVGVAAAAPVVAASEAGVAIAGAGIRVGAVLLGMVKFIR